MAPPITFAESNLRAKKSRAVLLLIAACFTLSGAAGLIYEVLWMRMLGLVFGATTIAVSVVLAAFMGGLALGSALAARVTPRIRRPLRAYAWIEIVIGLYAVIVPTAFRVIDHLDATLWQRVNPGTFGFAIVRFLLAGVVLLVPTALMGATLPMIVAAIRQCGATAPQIISRFYGLNLIGAILGTLAAGFVLLPGLGIRVTIRIAAVTNVVIGLVMLLGARSASVTNLGLSSEVEVRDQTTDASRRSQFPIDRGLWFGCAFASGFITIG